MRRMEPCVDRDGPARQGPVGTGVPGRGGLPFFEGLAEFTLVLTYSFHKEQFLMQALGTVRRENRQRLLSPMELTP